MSITNVLNAFLASDDFASGVLSSTKAGFGGSSYKVELFQDGTWRVLWANEIGNLYESPGEILSIPQLNDSDYQDLCDMAESEEDEAILQHLRNSDTLQDLENYMRDSYSNGFIVRSNNVQ